MFICAEKFGALYEFRWLVTAICFITIELGGHCGDKMSALEFVVRFNAYIWLFFQTPCPWINDSEKIYDHENEMAIVLFCNNAQMRFIYDLFNRNIQINSIKELNIDFGIRFAMYIVHSELRMHYMREYNYFFQWFKPTRILKNMFLFVKSIVLISICYTDNRRCKCLLTYYQINFDEFSL